MQSLRARARTRARGLTFFTILSELKFHGGLPKNHQDPTVAELSAENHFPIVNANP